MRITVEATERIVEVDVGAFGVVPARVWRGVTETGVPVEVYITRISPQTHDAEVNRRFAEELGEAPETRLVGDRLVL